MSMDFVRYSSDVEQPEADFDESLKLVIQTSKNFTENSVKGEGLNRAVRDAHAKGYGLAKAEVEILDGLPREYAQGIYASPGRHDALIRFSNGSPHAGSDSHLGSAVVGMGLKIFGIEGTSLLEDEPDSHTFDYALINAPVFFASSFKNYVFIQNLFLSAGEYLRKGKAGLHEFLYDWVTGKGTLEPQNWAWDDLAIFLSLRQVQPVNLLLSSYWSMGAVRHGDYVAKIRATPTPEAADKVTRRRLDPKSEAEVFAPALAAELQERPFEFDLQVQLCTDLEKMPVEDLTVTWSEVRSPFVTVAKVRLPRQDISAEGLQEKMDATSITPWRVTEEHRPLGEVQRARKEVYRQSSILRHELNHQTREEPEDLSAIFDTAAADSR